MRKSLGLIAMGVALAAATPAAAAPVIPINTVALFSGTGANISGNAININDGTVKVQVTAWSSTTPGYWSSSNGRSRSNLGMWEHGIGAQYSGSDWHTVDNKDRTDYILLQFDTAVALNTVTFTSGWNGYDSDATISHANVNFASFGGTYKSTSTSFWNSASTQLRSNMTHSNSSLTNSGHGVATSRREVNPTLVTSNVWIVAAKIGNQDSYKDSFKLKGFTYVDPYAGAVPEPSTWAMLIIGMGMVGGAMRRKAQTRIALA